MSDQLKQLMPKVRAASPLFGVLITYGIYRLFFNEAGIYGIRIGIDPSDLHAMHDPLLATLQPTLGRLGWSVTGAFFVLSFIAAVITLGRILYQRMRDGSLFGGARSLITLPLLVVLVGFLSYGDNPFTTKYFGPVLQRTFVLLDMPNAEIWLHLLIPMVLAVIVLLVAVAMSALVQQEPKEASGVLQLLGQYRDVNTVLLVGATMLVAGIVHASAIHRLPVGFLDEAVARHLDHLVSGLSASTGAVWTLLLLSIYLPSMLDLRTRAHRLARENVTDPTPEKIDKWLLERGLKIHVPQHIAHAAALFSPLIVGGPAAPLLQLITG